MRACVHPYTMDAKGRQGHLVVEGEHVCVCVCVCVCVVCVCVCVCVCVRGV